jgi:hypothetical protein
LPQENEAPLPVINGSNGAHLPPPSEALEVAQAAHDSETPQTQFSPSSAGAFENLREMLGKLRQPSAPVPGTEEAARMSSPNGSRV